MLCVGLGVMAGAAMAQTSGPIYHGGFLDYQPAPLRLDNGDLLVIIERLRLPTNSGDLYVTRSHDKGATWDPPSAIVSSDLNERHPSVVQLADGSLSLFYMVSEGRSVYRIHRATSPDGVTWTLHGAIDLGWSTGLELNPSVIRDSGGALLLTYQVRSGAAFIARSTDGGETWDSRRTQLSEGWAALPRITQRAQDGLFVVVYQVNPGGGYLQLRAKASSDPYDWSGPSSEVSSGANTHDPQPLTLEDGSFLVTYIDQSGTDAFDLYYRTSMTGLEWSPATRITRTTTRYDVQPHPILQGTPGMVSLFWSYQDGAIPYSQHDIWMMKDLPVTQIWQASAHPMSEGSPLR